MLYGEIKHRRKYRKKREVRTLGGRLFILTGISEGAIKNETRDETQVHGIYCSRYLTASDSLLVVEVYSLRFFAPQRC